jgi:NhaP-type Na+/H+ or K+/H+ antiporter
MLPLLAYAAALAVSGNGFVAAFVAGTAFAGSAAWCTAEPSALALTEAFSKPLVYAVWLIFGLLAVPAIVREVGIREVAFAVLSLTVLRMGPVALSLVGSGLQARTALFVGWFGPRGLASIVFALIALESLDINGPLRVVVTTIALTVLLSVLAHGLSAPPLARRYGAWVRAAQPLEETKDSLEPQSRNMHHG